ncbi:MAG: NifB/NifX family molybdenum-iron cluster-binding protein [Deltaproteobacteria bacterium]|nr:NifB/NifX family molybdenum-iron cluster-binding protein [Deltaproteobacteria bacterium]MBW1853601.1 NifB/NifX family molybdenum-iron cluster-binding protein [Deltaproteobacteria bacterium]
MKKIALACEDNQGLDGQISQHFGRCPYYLLVEVEGSEIKKTDAVDNPYYDDHIPGMVPKFINEQGANVMVAGGMGPRAIDMFSNFGIEVVTGAVGNTGNVLQAYLKGEISGVEPCKHDHPGDHDNCQK